MTKKITAMTTTTTTKNFNAFFKQLCMTLKCSSITSICQMGLKYKPLNLDLTNT